MSGLVLTRKPALNQNSIVIDGKLKITVIEIKGKQVQLRFTNLTDEQVKVDRAECIKP